jgi:subtilisin family serine protease
VVSDKRRGGTALYWGTSAAAPHVAGAVALCLGNGGAAGPCAGQAPAQVMATVRSNAAAAATFSNGFLGDPLHPLSGKYFGHLVATAGY